MTPTLKALKKLDETQPWDWPEGTAASLLDVLRDRGSGEEERVLAAELAGSLTVISDELALALLAALRSTDEAEKVRCCAAVSLGPVLELCDTDGFDDPASVPISEHSFHEIQEAMRRLYLDVEVPEEVRRRILAASARAPLDWHEGAIRAAYGCDDGAWRLTAVSCMRHVIGFDEQILASLHSKHSDLHAEAVEAAGTWAIDAAWPHVLGLITTVGTDRRLLLAAISAVGGIRPQQAAEVLDHLADSEDPEIAEAVVEASSLTDCEWDEEDEDLDEDEEPGPLH